MILLLLLACPGRDTPDDTGTDSTTGCTGTECDTYVTDSTPETGTTVPEEGSLGEADASFIGAPSDAAGNFVGALGDVNDDGYDDVIVGGYYGNHACAWFGPVPAGRNAFADAPVCFDGEDRYDFMGYSADSVGDLTGDGVPDVVVAALGNQDMGLNAGKAYLFAGPITPGAWPGAEAWAAFTGETSGDYLGVAVRGLGDVDGDGQPDLGLGASGNDASGNGGGRLYLYSGPLGAGTRTVGDAPITITGLPPVTPTPPPPHGSYGGGDAVGDAFDTPGDFDGDGFVDLAVGGPGDATNGASAGKAVLFFGPLAAGDHPMDGADVVYYGGATAGYAGSPLSRAGDVDADGRDDLFVSADGVDGGTVYLLLGTPGPESGLLADRASTHLVSGAGPDEEDQAGYSLAGGSDFDGDGFLDVGVGAPGLDRPPPACQDTAAVRYDAGGIYLVYGPFLPGTVDLRGGAVLGGECEGDNAGRSVAAAGDVNGDGLGDVLTGAPYNDDGGSFSGKGYLVLGR